MGKLRALAPTRLQGDWIPERDGGETRRFDGQLDFIGDNFNLADVGLIHGFVCSGWGTMQGG